MSSRLLAPWGLNIDQGHLGPIQLRSASTVQEDKLRVSVLVKCNDQEDKGTRREASNALSAEVSLAGNITVGVTSCQGPFLLPVASNSRCLPCCTTLQYTSRPKSLVAKVVSDKKAA